MKPDDRPRVARFLTSWWNILLVLLLMFIGGGFIPDQGRNPRAEAISTAFFSVAMLLCVGFVVAGLISGFTPRVADRCCKCCGYDLTGNTSGVCPECGTRIVNEAFSVTSVCSCSDLQEQSEGTEDK